MTDTQMSQAFESEIVHPKKRPLWRWLVLFGVMPVALAALSIVGYVQLARAQDQKRIVEQAPQVFHLLDRTGVNSNPNVPMVTSNEPNQWIQPGQQQQNFSITPNSPQGTMPGQNYQVETIYEYAPVADPNTGVLQYRPQARTEYRSVQPGSWPGVNASMPNQSQHTGHDPRVHQLVNELRSLQNEGADQSQILMQLQSLLDEEFTAMHKRQADEIEATEKRLVHLKKVHEERGNNRSQIIQRRIDQLTGKSNPLDWDMNPSMQNPPSGFYFPSNSGFPQATRASQEPLGFGPVQSALPPGATLGSSANFNRPVLTSPATASIQSTFTPSTPDRVSTQGPNALQPPRSIADSRQVDTAGFPNSDGYSRSANMLSRLNEFFSVISSASEARTEERAKAKMVDAARELHGQGALPLSELQQSQLDFEIVSRKQKVLAAQLNAIRSTLVNEMKTLENRLIETERVLESASTDLQKRAKESELTQLRDAYRSASELLAQFEEAMKVLNEDNDPEPSTVTVPPKETKAASGTQEQTPTPNQKPTPLPQNTPAEDTKP